MGIREVVPGDGQASAHVPDIRLHARRALEAHEIESAPLTDEQKRELLQTHATDKRIGAICGCIMIIATIVGLVMLFVPTYSYAQSLFWRAWPIGGLLCGIVSLLMKAFDSEK